MTFRNIRLHPALRIIYFLLRLLVWVSVRVFYRHRLVLGGEHARFDGPAIVVVNHPSTLTDVLNPALEIRQEMFFLANYGMFKHPVANWLLRRLFCIPVKRREDVTEGEERNNYEAFEQSFRHIEQNGILFIAVEGTSWMNRFVRPLKSGAARIAFGAEARNNWNLDVKIIPAGLSYSAPNLFRSDVVVHFGPAVYPREWAQTWAQNRSQAVEALTGHLEEALKSLSIHTRDEAGEQLVTRLEEILRNERPLPLKAAFGRSQQLARFAPDQPALQKKTGSYFEALASHRLSDAAVAATQRPGLRARVWTDGLLLSAGFPLFAVGYLLWFLPCYLPWLLNKKLDLYIGYSSTVKILAGMFTFPLAFWGVFRLAVSCGLNAGQAWLALVLFAGLGCFAERYLDLFKRFSARRSALRKSAGHAGAIRELQQQRAGILQTLDGFFQK